MTTSIKKKTIAGEMASVVLRFCFCSGSGERNEQNKDRKMKRWRAQCLWHDAATAKSTRSEYSFVIGIPITGAAPFKESNL
jgi:hypothetical protein